MKLKLYTVRWFRDTKGKYLTMSESDNVKTIKALDLQSAIEIAHEMEKEDSEIPFSERVTVTPKLRFGALEQ